MSTGKTGFSMILVRTRKTGRSKHQRARARSVIDALSIRCPEHGHTWALRVKPPDSPTWLLTCIVPTCGFSQPTRPP